MQAKPIAFAKSSLWVKNSNSKKHVKIYLQVTYSCSVQKTAWKTPNIREMRAF